MPKPSRKTIVSTVTTADTITTVVEYIYSDGTRGLTTTVFHAVVGEPSWHGVRAVFGPFDVDVDVPQRFGAVFNAIWVHNFHAPYSN